jgi:hypothetical protein
MRFMAFDLRGALLKKEERESARLAEFEFRLRARTFRLLAADLQPGEDPSEILGLVARMDDPAALGLLGRNFPDRLPPLHDLYARCRAQARLQLIGELGDPSPYRLA